ncbi:MAG: hypothetical protein AB1635_20800 [Acidobacteriota bacterium]
MRAHVTALQLFDVAESIDLARLPALLGTSAVAAKLETKSSAPAYVRYHVPPVQVDAAALGMDDVEGWRLRFRVFDYGVVSVSLTRQFTGDWTEATALAARITSDAALERSAEARCRALVDRIGPALRKPRERYLSEDYLVFAVTGLDQPMTADALVRQHGDDIARLVRGEQSALSAQERDEIFRHGLSYLADDLVVPTWSTAFVYDTEAGAQAAVEIFEFANSQLLQFRYYDELLDAEMEKLYAELESQRGYKSWLRRRYTGAARHVHALFVDVTELTDRTENALKLVGDVYASRLLALAHSRLGVTAWRDSVHEKLKTLDEIYRFAVDQTGMERGAFLELAIVLILVFELILFFMGIMQ